MLTEYLERIKEMLDKEKSVIVINSPVGAGVVYTLTEHLKERVSLRKIAGARSIHGKIPLFRMTDVFITILPGYLILDCIELKELFGNNSYNAIRAQVALKNRFEKGRVLLISHEDGSIIPDEIKNMAEVVNLDKQGLARSDRLSPPPSGLD